MLVNLIIIYFACGSPVGVYRISRTTNWRSSRLSAIGAYFVFWPIFVPSIVRHSLFENNPNAVESEIVRIRVAMEKIAYAAQSISIFTFKDVFARFTSLTMALNQGESPSCALFDVTGHENPALALTCLDRRNRRRLVFHQFRARKDLIQMILSLRGHDSAIVDLGLQLAGIMKDNDTANKLSRLKISQETG